MIIKSYFLNELERETHEQALLKGNAELDKEFILSLDDKELLELCQRNRTAKKVYVQ